VSGKTIPLAPVHQPVPFGTRQEVPLNRPIPKPTSGGSYLLAESVLTIDQAAKKNGTVSGVVHQWRRRGLRGGILLECYLRGPRWITSEEALIRFFDRVNAAARGEPIASGDPGSPTISVARTSAQRKAASEQAARECQALGV
jgi:hypothetical protein